MLLLLRDHGAGAEAEAEADAGADGCARAACSSRLRCHGTSLRSSLNWHGLHNSYLGIQQIYGGVEVLVLSRMCSTVLGWACDYAKATRAAEGRRKDAARRSKTQHQTTAMYRDEGGKMARRRRGWGGCRGAAADMQCGANSSSLDAALMMMDGWQFGQATPAPLRDLGQRAKAAARPHPTAPDSRTAPCLPLAVSGCVPLRSNCERAGVAGDGCGLLARNSGMLQRRRVFHRVCCCYCCVVSVLPASASCTVSLPNDALH
jgi:hypothetical protein